MEKSVTSFVSQCWADNAVRRYRVLLINMTCYNNVLNSVLSKDSQAENPVLQWFVPRSNPKILLDESINADRLWVARIQIYRAQSIRTNRFDFFILEEWPFPKGSFVCTQVTHYRLSYLSSFFFLSTNFIISSLENFLSTSFRNAKP